MPDSLICEWESAGWLMADLEIVVDPGNNIPIKLFDCYKGFSIFLAESFEISLKKLSIKINKKVKNFPNFLRTEKADISDIT
jgi:hypothetical protein